MSLHADLQRVVQQISDANAEEKRPSEPESGTDQTAPAAIDIPEALEDGEIGNDRHVAGVFIGVDVDRNSATKLERVEVTPEPDGRVSITIRAKREQ
jgi:hypothetical protein